MARRRFYSPQLNPGRLQLDADQSQHVRRVLRLDVGDMVELFDGGGAVAEARIVEIERSVVVEVAEVAEAPRPKPWIDLAAAVPKGSRADVLVEKASELGADRLIPLLTDRSVVDPRAGKLDRFERLAVASAKQCHRAWTMTIDSPTSMQQVMNRAAEWDLKLIADTTVDAGGGVQLIPSAAADAERVIVLIGPEGGWSENERNAAFSAGFRPWRLGPNVLRIETAALAALAILRQQA